MGLRVFLCALLAAFAYGSPASSFLSVADQLSLRLPSILAAKSARWNKSAIGVRAHLHPPSV